MTMVMCMHFMFCLMCAGATFLCVVCVLLLFVAVTAMLSA